MPSLRDLQQAFAAALLSEADHGVYRHVVEDGFTGEERLSIYRNSCRSVLVAALRLTYPAVDRLVGRDFFDAAAGRFALAHPPASGYLNAYGGTFFADFLADFDAATTVPYLPDVARFEWALAAAANARDAPALDPGLLSGVDAARHGAIRFIPHPSVHILSLCYPADRIADAVLSGDEAAMREVDLAKGPVHLVVHRGPEGVEVERLDWPDREFLAGLCAGADWASLVEKAPSRASALLAEQFVKGRLTAFRVGRAMEIHS